MKHPLLLLTLSLLLLAGTGLTAQAKDLVTPEIEISGITAAEPLSLCTLYPALALMGDDFCESNYNDCMDNATRTSDTVEEREAKEATCERNRASCEVDHEEEA